MTPHRRWFRFTLRTLFVVVTVLGCGLGYQLNWIRERHRVLDKFNLIEGNGLRVECWRSVDMTGTFSSLARSAPLSLRVLGEPGVGDIRIEAPPDIAHAEERHVRKLFPEARISVSYRPRMPSEAPPAAQVDRPE